jgi:flagellar hook assembly protein FlgD
MVAIVVYDINGREIRSLFDGMKESGQYSISWDALDNYGNPVSAGVYLYHIQTDRFSQSRKMILLK